MATNTYAVVEVGGNQHRVAEGDFILVDRMPDKEGAKVALRPLMLRGKDVILDAKGLEKVKVEATVRGHERGDKIRVFKFKPKRGYKRTTGHRQELTRLEVTKITGGGAAAAKPAEAKAEAKPAAAEKAEAKPAAAKAEAKPAATKAETEPTAKAEAKPAAAKAEAKPVAEVETKPAAAKADKPDAEAKPAAKKPAAEKPAAKKPAAKKPAEKKPAAKKPAAKDEE
jgi:large subunit ribosomal protein L21